MKLVVIGASYAGLNLLKSLGGNFSKSIVCLDKYPYKKNLLLEFLVGSISSKELLFERDFFNLPQVDYVFSKKALRINTNKGKVFTEDRQSLEYDILIIATGSRPKYLSCPGVHKRGVVSLYTLEDIKYIKDVIDFSSHVVMYTQTNLGLRILSFLKEKALDFKIISTSEHFAKYSIENQELINEERVILDVEVSEIIGNGDVKALRLSSGKIIACDLFIVDTGLKPNLEIVRNTDIVYEEAIFVDDNFSTNIENIFALGDVINKDLPGLKDFSGQISQISSQVSCLKEVISHRFPLTPLT